jgi:hypothetical protein
MLTILYHASVIATVERLLHRSGILAAMAQRRKT